MLNRDMPAKGFYKPNDYYGCEKTFHGLTKRESAAIAAMQGFCANPQLHTTSFEIIASWAVKQADALFDELEKEGPAHE